MYELNRARNDNNVHINGMIPRHIYDRLELEAITARSHILLVTRSADNSMVEVAIVDSAGKVYAANEGKYINSISLLQPSILAMGNSLVSCCGRFCWHVCV